MRHREPFALMAHLASWHRTEAVLAGVAVGTVAGCLGGAALAALVMLAR
jgi:hypothetical protein